jgi:predicted transcriptional regulator
MSMPNRDVREIIRDEHVMRPRILKVLADGPKTIPEIAGALGCPSHEVVFWVMGMRKYGFVAEIKEVTDEGYYQYQAVVKEGV